MDYVHTKLGITFSYLLELPPSINSPFGFALPAEEIAGVSDEVLLALLVTIDEIDRIRSQEG